MSKQTTEEIAPRNLIEHPAARAWSELRQEEMAPSSIEVLKDHDKSMVTRLMGLGRDGSPVIAKRCRKQTAAIERSVYEEILPRLALPVLHYYGSVDEAASDFTWLFFEDAGGEKYVCENPQHRVLAAQWFGHLHVGAARIAAARRLPSRDSLHYLGLIRSVRDTFRERLSEGSMSADTVTASRTLMSQYTFLETHWTQVEGFCERMPQTLVHGDFVRRNIRVRSRTDRTELMVFDWECAGFGMPGIDLAQIGDSSVGPDLPTYHSILREHWPRLEWSDITRLAAYGAIFRVLVCVNWGTWSFDCDWACRSIQDYATMLANSIRSISWEG